MDKLIAEFEASHPGWGWLVRNRHQSVDAFYKGYFAHVMHPNWHTLGSEWPSFKGYGNTAIAALEDAIRCARMQ